MPDCKSRHDFEQSKKAVSTAPEVAPPFAAGQKRRRKQQHEEKQQMIGSFFDMLHSKFDHSAKRLLQIAFFQVYFESRNLSRSGISGNDVGFRCNRNFFAVSASLPIVADRNKCAMRDDLVHNQVVIEGKLSCAY